MNLLVAAVLAVVSAVVTPAKTWYAPAQPWTVQVKGAEAGTQLVMSDFVGKAMYSAGPTDVAGDAVVDLKAWFPGIGSGTGTYVLYAVKEGGKDVTNFTGTPLIVDVREDRRRPGSGPMVMRVRPMEYAVITTDAGPMTALFYYDTAPRTVDNFIMLARQGFYDGLTFHRIIPGYLIQGGDPTGTGTGGPGYTIQAEFSDRNHLQGVMSMARSVDPNEAAGALPRAEFADSAGSQFFISLDYAKTRNLDHRYTSFGRVVDGMEVVNTLEKLPLADAKVGKPVTPPVIRSIEVLPVTAGKNPYAQLVKMENVPTTAPVSSEAREQAEATTRPAGVPLEPPARKPALEQP